MPSMLVSFNLVQQSPPFLSYTTDLLRRAGQLSKRIYHNLDLSGLRCHLAHMSLIVCIFPIYWKLCKKAYCIQVKHFWLILGDFRDIILWYARRHIFVDPSSSAILNDPWVKIRATRSLRCRITFFF